MFSKRGIEMKKISTYIKISEMNTDSSLFVNSKRDFSKILNEFMADRIPQLSKLKLKKDYQLIEGWILL